MTRIATVAIIMCAWLSALPAAAGDQPLEVYRARLSETDHQNSKGAQLKSAAGIVRQDRANYHKFKKRDAEDQPDELFGERQNRDRMEEMLLAGSFAADVKKAILEGAPLVEVRIFQDHVEVYLVTGGEKTPPPMIEPGLLKDNMLGSRLSHCFPGASPFEVASPDYPVKKVEGVAPFLGWSVYHLHGKENRYLIFHKFSMGECQVFHIGKALARVWGPFLPMEKKVKAFLLSEGGHLALAIRNEAGMILAAAMIPGGPCDQGAEIQPRQIFERPPQGLEVVCDDGMGGADFSRSAVLFQSVDERFIPVLGPFPLGMQVVEPMNEVQTCTYSPAGFMAVTKPGHTPLVQVFTLEEQPAAGGAVGTFRNFKWDLTKRAFIEDGPSWNKTIKVKPECESHTQ